MSNYAKQVQFERDQAVADLRLMEERLITALVTTDALLHFAHAVGHVLRHDGLGTNAHQELVGQLRRTAEALRANGATDHANGLHRLATMAAQPSPEVGRG
jgi:hypothetical protein